MFIGIRIGIHVELTFFSGQLERYIKIVENRGEYS